MVNDHTKPEKLNQAENLNKNIDDAGYTITTLYSKVLKSCSNRWLFAVQVHGYCAGRWLSCR